jgi:AcrR family transcriptional regulator
MKTGNARSDEVRAPRQLRSLQRVEQILAAAKDIITIKGTTGLTIVEIAQMAGVTPGSMYQYFPNKGAIVTALGAQYLKEFGEKIGEALSTTPNSKADLLDLLGTLLMEYYKVHREDPVVRDILMGVAVDKSLQDLNEEDTKKTVELILRVAQPFYGEVPEKKLRMHIRLGIGFLETATRLAVKMPKQDGLAVMEMTQSAQAMMWAALDHTN